MEQALKATVPEPTAMALATAGNNGKPSARMVLLKGFDDSGFVFYTNYRSRKAEELNENPHAAAIIYWAELERQVRIEGSVEKISALESDEYFSTRPEESQVSAIVSPQSRVVPDRAYLYGLKEAYLKLKVKEHSRPDHWGGYRICHNTIEFWQGRPGRLHDRIRYSRSGNNWKIERLAP
jgi:pyridoxamine 5'-phosphate oxidase